MVKKGIFCLCMTVLILGGCTLGGVSLKGKEKHRELCLCSNHQDYALIMSKHSFSMTMYQTISCFHKSYLKKKKPFLFLIMDVV